MMRTRYWFIAASVNAVTSFFPEMVGSLVAASQVAALEYGASAEVAVARSVALEAGALAEAAAARLAAFAPKHSCDIPELYLCY
jgi:hypothetical protein